MVITEDPRTYEELTSTVKRLSHLSVKGYYNPYQSFDWPESIPDGELWMSRDLLTIHGAGYDGSLSHDDLVKLSKWESVNFYSLNVHGIRELMSSVVKRLHTPRHQVVSEFLHHFLGEENEHMWFFSEFCYRYAGKMYPTAELAVPAASSEDVDDLLTFVRITIFEEVVDYYNVRMGADRTLPTIIQKINRMHHVDESRHIAFGRQLIETLFQRVRSSETAEDVRFIQDYIGRYINHSLRLLYSPAAYRDAGIADPLRVRREVMTSGRFKAHGEAVLARTMKFLTKLELVADNWSVEAS